MARFLTARLSQATLLEQLVVVQALRRVDHAEEGVVTHGRVLAQVVLEGAEQLVQPRGRGAVLHAHRGHVLHRRQRPLVALQHREAKT